MASLVLCALLIFLVLQISSALSVPAFVAQISSSPSSPAYLLKLRLGTPKKHTALLQLDLNRAVSSLKCARKQPFPLSVTFNTTNGITDLSPFTVPKLLFECTSANVAALSDAARALPAQLAKRGGLARKFAYCLPPHGGTNPGPIFFGNVGSYIFQSGPPVNVSGVLSHTALLKTKLGYALALQGITVSDQNLKIKSRNLYISSVEPYTKLTSSVYKLLRNSFRTNAFYNSTAAPAVAPFDTCFNASHFASTRAGLGVPVIDLLLPNNAIWSIWGMNSVVSVSDSVICLAFVDAGAGKPSVLGTFQQQDNLLEFDLEKSRLGFSGLLDFYRTLCADFLF